MRYLHQALATRKRLGAKVRANPKSDHRDLVQHGYGQRLVHLLGCEELGLINQHAGHAVTEIRPLRGERLECRSQILTGREQQICPARHAEAGHNLIVALGIHRRLDQHDALVALLIIVGHLQHGGALTAVHGAVTEKEFAHIVTSANRAVAVK